MLHVGQIGSVKAILLNAAFWYGIERRGERGIGICICFVIAVDVASRGLERELFTDVGRRAEA